MDSFWIIFIVVTCLVILYLYLTTNTPIENLRIQGSHDIRGDPFIIPMGNVGPFNIGSSVPIYNRPMEME